MTPSGAAPSRSQPDRYFPCIDGLRAAAAIMVVAFHVAGPATGVNAGDSWVADYTNQLGRLGVSIFFAISGFLLYRPFVVAHLGRRPAPALGPYFRRRFLRIFPAYWLALAAFILLASPAIRASITDHLLLRVSLLQGYSRSLGLTGIAVAWTLTIELTFYVVLPLYAWGIRRLGTLIGRDGRLSAEWLGLVLLYAVGVTARWLVTDKVYPGALAGFLAWTDLFAMGMVIAVVRARQKAGGPLPAVFRYLGRYPLLGVAIALELVWVVAMLDVPTGFAPRSLGDELARHVCYGLVGFLLLAPLVFGNQQRTWYRRALRSVPVRWTGEVSYGIYLWHLLVLYLLTKGIDRGDSVSYWPLFGATLAITAVIASASWVLLERPIQRVRLGGLLSATSRVLPSSSHGRSQAATADDATADEAIADVATSDQATVAEVAPAPSNGGPPP